jgi:predicted DNA-binding protein YlxM (UPF0122 family)
MPKQPNLIVGHALKSAKLTTLQAYVLGRYMDGLKQREIAEEIGSSRQAVAKTIKVSIIKLRSVVPLFNEMRCNQRGILTNK